MFFNYFIFATNRTSYKVYLGKKKNKYMDNKKNTQRKENKKIQTEDLDKSKCAKMKPEFLESK